MQHAQRAALKICQPTCGDVVLVGGIVQATINDVLDEIADAAGFELDFQGDEVSVETFIEFIKRWKR